MIDRTEIMAKAAASMQGRVWKSKLAKKRGGEQGLFEHRQGEWQRSRYAAM